MLTLLTLLTLLALLALLTLLALLALLRNHTHIQSRCLFMVEVYNLL